MSRRLFLELPRHYVFIILPSSPERAGATMAMKTYDYVMLAMGTQETSVPVPPVPLYVHAIDPFWSFSISVISGMPCS